MLSLSASKNISFSFRALYMLIPLTSSDLIHNSKTLSLFFRHIYTFFPESRCLRRSSKSHNLLPFLLILEFEHYLTVWSAMTFQIRRIQRPVTARRTRRHRRRWRPLRSYRQMYCRSLLSFDFSIYILNCSSLFILQSFISIFIFSDLCREFLLDSIFHRTTI